MDGPLFSPGANLVARMILLGVLVVVVALFWAADSYMQSDYYTGTYQAVTQPVQFSHEHHVGGLGIDCRYCHTSVEVSAYANIPPTQTCMNCHSQIWLNSPYLEPVRESWRTGKPLVWQRVHNLADFVYFNHSIHVHKGVGCVTCHGRVDRMPLVWQVASLQMQWCLECHRQPEHYLRPREYIYSMDWEPPGDQVTLGRQLVKEYNLRSTAVLTSCDTCHR